MKDGSLGDAPCPILENPPQGLYQSARRPPHVGLHRHPIEKTPEDLGIFPSKVLAWGA